MIAWIFARMRESVAGHTLSSSHDPPLMHSVVQVFSDCVFGWHLETGHQGRLLSYGGLSSPTSHGGSTPPVQWASELARVLKGQPPSNTFNASQWLLKLKFFQISKFGAKRQILIFERTSTCRKVSLLLVTMSSYPGASMKQGLLPCECTDLYGAVIFDIDSSFVFPGGPHHGNVCSAFPNGN